MDGTGIGSRVHGSLAIPAPVTNEPAYFKYAGFAFKAASNGVDRRQLARSLVSPIPITRNRRCNSENVTVSIFNVERVFVSCIAPLPL